MTKFTPIRYALAVPALLVAQTAWADLTPAQVWGDWKAYMEGMGYGVSANEAANGADLTVSDITMSLQLPDNAGSVAMSMGTIGFIQDGADVNVILPNVMPFSMRAADGPQQFSMTMEYVQSGQVMRASGTPDKATYTYSADTVSMVLKEFASESENIGPDFMKMDISATGVNGATTMTIADMRRYDQTGSIENMSYDIAMKDPNEQVDMKMTGRLAGLTFDGGGVIPLTLLNSGDMAAMLKAGFAMAGQFNYTSGSALIDVTDPSNGNFAAQSSSQGGGLAVVMNENELGYSGQQNTVAVNVQAQALPFPIDFSMARSGFNLAMPVGVSQEPKDFAFGITLGDFVMSDLIWSIFDPTAQLPRDPATIELDLTGKAKMLVDIFDPEMTASADAPGELHAMTLGKLLVDAAGAKLEGNGDFTFDNSDTATYDGMPKPVGAINLALAGGNGLMDKLVAMGLLPEEQAMGARMMMGLFAVPGDAPDTLKSTVEFNEAGQILANGQRIK